MSYLFLDIDGVLNSQLYYERLKAENNDVMPKGGVSDLDTRAMVFLNSFIEDTKVEVVISSTWRAHATIDELQVEFEERGFENEIKDFTPHVNALGVVRGNEIRAWINENENSQYKQYVIFDDDSDMLLWQSANYFRVDGYVGLTPNICYRANRF